MIKQLSVFVENQTGSVYNVTDALSEAGINIRAVASFDTPDFAIMRLVVDKEEEAKDYLTGKGFVVRVHEVIGVELEDRQGALNEMLKVLADNKISLNYIYSFIIRGGKAPVMVFSTDMAETAVEAMKREHIKLVEEADL